MLKIKNIIIFVFILILLISSASFLFSSRQNKVNLEIGSQKLIFDIPQDAKLIHNLDRKNFGVTLHGGSVLSVSYNNYDYDQINEVKKGWPTIYPEGVNIQVVGKQYISDNFTTLGSINNIEVYRDKYDSDKKNDQLKVYGLVENRLSPVFIDVKNIFWNIIYEIKSDKPEEDIKIFDNIISQINI